MADSTTEYKRFKELRGNRVVNQEHVTRIGKAIALRPELLKERPILVNEKMEVIDGQHRLEAARKLRVPIYYEVGTGLTVEDAIALNRNQRNWTILDFARSHASNGNESYTRFLELNDEYRLAPSVLQTYLQLGYQLRQTANFKEGKFEISDETTSLRYLDYLADLAELDKRVKTGSVSEALLTIFKSENYDHDRMLKKMKMWGDTAFNPYGNKQDIMRSLEAVYNFHQTEKGITRLF